MKVCINHLNAGRSTTVFFFLLIYNGPMASSQVDQNVHAAAQHSTAGGRRMHRAEPESPLTASQQGHTHEDQQKSRAVYLV